jgi:CHAD domain-containing protein
MTDLKPSRWIPGITPDDSTCVAARQALRARLDAVLRLLPHAAGDHGEDPECVHQLRVATRRSAAALRLFADLLPSRLSDWLGKKLKGIRQAAGETRDLDVLIHRLQKKHADLEKASLLEHLRARREDARHLIRDVHKDLARKDRFRRRVEKLLGRVRAPKGDFASRQWRFGDWARRRLRMVLERFFQAMPASDADVEGLHRLRIRGKELRYAMELLAGAFPPAFHERDYPVVEALQERLGGINDHATALCRLRERLEATDDPEEAGRLQTLIGREVASLEQCRREFLAWWTPQRQGELRGRLEEVTQPRRETVPAWQLSS